MRDKALVDQFLESRYIVSEVQALSEIPVEQLSKSEKEALLDVIDSMQSKLDYKMSIDFSNDEKRLFNEIAEDREILLQIYDYAALHKDAFAIKKISSLFTKSIITNQKFVNKLLTRHSIALLALCKIHQDPENLIRIIDNIIDQADDMNYTHAPLTSGDGAPPLLWLCEAISELQKESLCTTLLTDIACKLARKRGRIDLHTKDFAESMQRFIMTTPAEIRMQMTEVGEKIISSHAFTCMFTILEDPSADRANRICNIDSWCGIM